MENSRTCDIGKINVHRASIVKHLGSEKHLENIIQNEMIIPEWFFREGQKPTKNKIKKYTNLKH